MYDMTAVATSDAHTTPVIPSFRFCKASVVVSDFASNLMCCSFVVSDFASNLMCCSFVVSIYTYW